MIPRRPLLASLLALLVAGCAQHEPDDVITLVYATPYTPGHPFSRADRSWMEFVERQSGGKLRIRANWAGGLLSSDHSMQELRHGVADIGLITPIYAKGGAHLLRIQAGFYSGIETIEQQVELYRCMAEHVPQFARELEGLRVLAVQGGSLPGIVTRERPVLSLADLRGLRLRAPTELLQILRTLGADPVNMPMGEVYSALAKGVIDGVIAPADTFRSLHFVDVAKHYTALPIPRGAYASRAIGERRWRELPESARRVLEESVPIWEAAFAREVRAAFDEGLRTAAEAGIGMHEIDADGQRSFTELYRAQAERNAAALAKYGIDGSAVLALARASIRPDGGVNCNGGN